MTNNSLSLEQLENVEKTTLNHYNVNAQSFWHGTKGHDVSQNYSAFLSQCKQGASLDILDFGCGPGRDVGYFKSLGHRSVGLDGSQIFCEMARQYSGCEILCQEFLTLDLSTAAFDAVFANASLFHVPSQELPRILTELHTCLRPGGILFSSNPRGNSEGWSGGRYGNFIEFDEASTILRAAHFSILSHYYRPEGVAKDHQPWLAIVCKSL
jgi:SAM-dependent methyltransferase